MFGLQVVSFKGFHFSQLIVSFFSLFLSVEAFGLSAAFVLLGKVYTDSRESGGEEDQF